MRADLTYADRLGWVLEHMHRTAEAVAALPPLDDVRLACSVHIEIKMVALFDALIKRGAQLFITTCNPQTVCDETVVQLRERGATVVAHRGMSEQALVEAVDRALAWRPTHLLEI